MGCPNEFFHGEIKGFRGYMPDPTVLAGVLSRL